MSERLRRASLIAGIWLSIAAASALAVETSIAVLDDLATLRLPL